MAFIRKIKKGDSVYLAKVESYREDGKVKQRVLEYIGKEVNGQAVKKVDMNTLHIDSVRHYADVQAMYQLCIQLKLNYLLGKHSKIIMTLLIAHLLCKGSVTRISQWIEKSCIAEIIGLDKVTLEMLYNSLDYLEELDFNKIENHLFDYWKELDPSDNKAYVLDVTDTYYKGKNDENVLRRGKDGKVAKLVQIGLAVSFTNGFPIMHKVFGGNISNSKILQSLTEQIAEKGMNSIILDRGFYSYSNIEELNELGMKMIVGMKQSIGVQNTILSKLNKDEIYTKSNLIQLKGTIIYAIQLKYFFGNLIVIYNPKYEVIKKDKMLSAGASDREVKYVGYSLIFHNTKYSIEETVKKYFEKDVVERSFRTMKGEASLHPIRVWVPTRVNAHVKICYLSMCILSLIKKRCEKLDISVSQVMRELEGIYKVKIKHESTKYEIEKIVTQSNLQTKILKLLKCSV